MKKINIVCSTKTVVLVLLLILDIFLNSVFSMETKNIFYQKSVPSLAPVLQKVLPSVISIKTNGHNNLHEFRLPKQLKPFFGENSPFCQKNSPFKNSPFCHFLPDNHGKLGETFHIVGSGV
ncbi:MAG: serine endoprotease, partial [Buchnera aphidicola]|nr:serine endoprotease [Buchnera aphidicola]